MFAEHTAALAIYSYSTTISRLYIISFLCICLLIFTPFYSVLFAQTHTHETFFWRFSHCISFVWEHKYRFRRFFNSIRLFNKRRPISTMPVFFILPFRVYEDSDGGKSGGGGGGENGGNGGVDKYVKNCTHSHFFRFYFQLMFFLLARFLAFCELLSTLWLIDTKYKCISMKSHCRNDLQWACVHAWVRERVSERERKRAKEKNFLGIAPFNFRYFISTYPFAHCFICHHEWKLVVCLENCIKTESDKSVCVVYWMRYLKCSLDRGTKMHT